jgi:hypothetical protein
MAVDSNGKLAEPGKNLKATNGHAKTSRPKPIKKQKSFSIISTISRFVGEGEPAISTSNCYLGFSPGIQLSQYCYDALRQAMNLRAPHQPFASHISNYDL